MLENQSLIPLYKNVLSWNKVYGNDINNQLLNTHSELLAEKTINIFNAIKDNNQIEFLRGLVDSIVVGSYLYALINKSHFNNYKENHEVVNIKNTVEKLNLIISMKQNIKEISIILTYLENISHTISGYIDIVEACNEVMNSNWSKFPLTSNVTPEDEINFIEEQGEYSNIKYSIIIDSKNNSRYVFKDNNGEIVKPSTFRAPFLEGFIHDGLSLI